MFDQGQYLESKEPWQQVIQMNNLFSFANVGLAEAYYREENYPEALQAFRYGGNKRGYSDTYWELRSEWLHSHLIKVIIGLIGLVLAWAILKAVDRRKRIFNPVRIGFAKVKRVDFLRQTAFMFHNVKHPTDTAYGIRFEGNASIASAGFWFAIFFVLYVWEKYFSGYLFKYVRDGYYDIVGDLITVLAIASLLTICCYLVCTITEGEAKFTDLTIGFVYALVPMIIIKPFVIIMTNVLTFNESVFITLANIVAYSWTGILIFLTIKNLNDYSVGKTIKTILLTIFTALIVALVLFVVYVLITQTMDFISSIFGEGAYRLGWLS
jgi:hypothetical protein